MVSPLSDVICFFDSSACSHLVYLNILITMKWHGITALENMKKMGITPLNLHTMSQLESTTDPVFEPGEKVYFHGFEVYESNKVDDETLSSNDSKNQEDDRIFHPYFASGTQSFGSPDRFLAKTPSPLPEGLCGGPVLTTQHDNKQPLFIRGVVEGIVPPNHENAELAGAASYLPSYRVREFIDFAERIMLEQIVDEDVFQRVIDIKERKLASRGTVYGEDQMNGGSNKDGEDDEITDPNILTNIEGLSEDDDTPNIDKAYQEIVSSLRQHHTPEEVDAILATVEREKKEVIEILEKDGGDMDDAIAKVRQRTYEERDRVLKELQEQMQNGSDESKVIDAEVVTKDEKR
jgi:gas vesicle protein